MPFFVLSTQNARIFRYFLIDNLFHGLYSAHVASGYFDKGTRVTGEGAHG